MAATPTTVSELKRPTPKEEIKTRKQSGIVLSYVTGRYVEDTFDEIVGPANWRTSFKYLGTEDGAVECTIEVLVDHGDGNLPEWVGKTDVGLPSTFEPMKGAYSDALKRAGKAWGVARDLYDTRDAPSRSAGGARSGSKSSSGTGSQSKPKSRSASPQRRQPNPPDLPPDVWTG